MAGLGLPGFFWLSSLPPAALPVRLSRVELERLLVRKNYVDRHVLHLSDEELLLRCQQLVTMKGFSFQK